MSRRIKGKRYAARRLSLHSSLRRKPAAIHADIIGGGIGNIVVMTGGGNAAGIGNPTGRNDDGFSGPIPLGFTLTFFGNNYTSFRANNNGNISFTGGISAFTPSGPQGQNAPIISPFFADVDTRTSPGVMRLRTDIPNEIIVTWDQAGFFGGHSSPTNPAPSRRLHPLPRPRRSAAALRRTNLCARSRHGQRHALRGVGRHTRRVGRCAQLARILTL